MREAVIDVHPWAEPFIEVHCVAHGVCAFPNYTECPIKGPIFNPETGRRWDEEKTARYIELYDLQRKLKLPKAPVATTHYPATPATREQIKTAWQAMRFEAVPAETK
jgi:hypothetical protein